MRVLVCGSRYFRQPLAASAAVAFRLDKLQKEADILRIEVEIYHGDAQGADRWAATVAATKGMKVRAFPADWESYGKRAGYLRNIEMLDGKPDLVLAFWNGISKGTKHTIDEAMKRGIPVEVTTLP